MQRQSLMNQIPNRIHTAHTHTIRGRENGAARSTDGVLDIRFSTPGSARIGTNPEQLFAAAWSASFASAIARAASVHDIALPGDVVTDAEIDLKHGDDGYFLAARLKVTLGGILPATARLLLDEAYAICPYCRATRGNIEVAISLA